VSAVTPPRVVVAAVGSTLRGDDGAGPAVLDRARGRLGPAELLVPLATPLDLLGAWDGAELAVVVDALRTGGPPGVLHVAELGPEAGPTGGGTARRAGSHGLGVVEVLRLSRSLGTAPERVVVVGIAGADFSPGAGLSPAVAGAVERAARWVVDAVRAVPRPAGDAT
jgi:hydrogenase maturation protease